MVTIAILVAFLVLASMYYLWYLDYEVSDKKAKIAELRVAIKNLEKEFSELSAMREIALSNLRKKLDFNSDV